MHCIHRAQYGKISARVPDDLEDELAAYLEDEGLDRSTAVRKLLAQGLDEWRQDQALERLAAGEITLSKAAEITGCSTWELAAVAESQDVTWVSSEHLADDLADL